MDAEDSQVSITAVATIFTAIAAMVGALVTAGLLQRPDKTAPTLHASETAVLRPSMGAWTEHADMICVRADQASQEFDGIEEKTQWLRAEQALAAGLRTMNSMLKGLEVPPEAVLRMRLMTQDWDAAAAAADRAAAAYWSGDLDKAFDEFTQLACYTATGDQIAFDLGIMSCAGARKVGFR